MIQQIQFFFENPRKFYSIVFGIIFFTFLLVFKKWHVFSHEDVDRLVSNLLQFSSIFTAILITYIFSKVFQIRQEKLERFKKIVILSNKLTDLRRIAAILVDCHSFWDATMVLKMNTTYKEIDYFYLHGITRPHQKNNSYLQSLRTKLLSDDDLGGYNLYIAMKNLYLKNKPQLYLLNEFDYDYTYTSNILDRWQSSHCANVLWYTLSHKWSVYSGCFNFNALSQKDQKRIEDLSLKIDENKYKGRTFDRKLLTEISSDMESFYIPELLKLTLENEEGLSKILKNLLFLLLVSVVFGVLIPIILTSLVISLHLTIIMASFSAIVLITNLIYFISTIYYSLTVEIKVP